MGAEFTVTPAMYGPVHLGILALVAAISAGLFFIFRRLDEKKLIRIIFILGAVMIAAEIWKQWFVIKYVYRGERSTWFFPWQLCSMAMYCAFAAFFFKGKAQDTLLVFLSTFTLVAALAALIFPGDMLRPQILLFIHSFLYHTAMVAISIASMNVLSRRKKARFLPAAVMFLIMAGVAEIINVVSHLVIQNIRQEANMFSITPYYPTTQPILHEVALALGIPAEIALYLALIILASFIIYAVFYAICGKKRI